MVELLRAWKAVAEFRASQELEGNHQPTVRHDHWAPAVLIQGHEAVKIEGGLSIGPNGIQINPY
jgi:hypothetical protein